MAHELLSQSRKRNERGGGLHKSGRRLHMYVTNVSVSSAVNMLKNPVDIRRPFNVDTTLCVYGERRYYFHFSPNLLRSIYRT